MEKKKKPFGLEKAEQQAEEVLRQDEEVGDVLDRASEKAHRYRERLKEVWGDIELLVQMLRAYRAGTYRHIPWKALIAATAALIYFLNPLDFLPDFLFGIGFLDDAAVIGFVINALREEIERFKSFSEGRTGEAPTATAENGRLSGGAAVS